MSASPQLVVAPAPAPSTARAKPLLRGVSHEIAAVASFPAVALLLGRAHGGRALLAAAVYGLSLVTLFSVSAVYHRRFWSLPTRQLVGRLDHSAIYLLIAGTYTPLGLRLGPGLGHWTLAAVWLGAALGVGVELSWGGLSKRVRAAVYVALGWVFLPALPALRAALGDGTFALFLAGGLAYTVGAVIFGMRRPDPFPRTFGFHEIFHLLVIAAAACHYLVVAAALRGLG